MRSPRGAAAAVVGVPILLMGGMRIFVDGSPVDAAFVATARRSTLAVTLTESGVLRAADSVTYRSPLEGREVEVTYLAPEGAQVAAGDLLAQLDTAALRTERERAMQSVQQVEMELQAAVVEREEAALALGAVTEGAGALAVDEGRTELQLAQTRARRLRDDHDRMQPLLAKGYITREEFDRSELEVLEAEARAHLAERAFKILAERTHPGEEQAARLRVARRDAHLDHLRPKLDAARAYVAALTDAIDRSAIRALRPGLVMYEDNLSTAPRRKIRAGDRVTPSQGLITLPDLRKMLVDASVRESDMHLVRQGQAVRVRIDALPDHALTGTVVRLGALARDTDEPRFDVVIALEPTPAALRPAMRVRADILVAERRDVVTVPATAVFLHEGVTICYVLRGSSVERRMVEVGGTDGTEIEVRAGLLSGEHVSLIELAASPAPAGTTRRARH